MVTWTFDLAAIIAGFLFGFFIGGLIVLLIEMREGGAWSKGFYEGCDLRHKIEDINSAVDYAKRSMTGWQSINKQQKDVKQK